MLAGEAAAPAPALLAGKWDHRAGRELPTEPSQQPEGIRSLFFWGK